MSKEKRKKGTQEIQRFSYEEYGIDGVRLAELQDGCRTGKYPPEMLQAACDGLEFVRPWILLSVTKNVSFDRLEFHWELGRCPSGRTNFYSFRRRFFYNLDKALREKEAVNG